MLEPVVLAWVAECGQAVATDFATPTSPSCRPEPHDSPPDSTTLKSSFVVAFDVAAEIDSMLLECC